MWKKPSWYLVIVQCEDDCFVALFSARRIFRFCCINFFAASDIQHMDILQKLHYVLWSSFQNCNCSAATRLTG